MHAALPVVLGLIISLYLAALVVAIVEILRAPMGYEDKDGFHEISPRPENPPRAPRLPRINRHLPLGGLS